MIRKIFGLFLGLCLVSVLHFGGAGGCGGGTTAAGGGGGGGGGAGTRNLTGTIAAGSLAGLTLAGKSQALACEDLTVCCGAYDGSLVVTEVGSDCSFSLALPLENFCYCCIFTGADADGNSCPDEQVACLGCSENGYSGAIPIFPEGDDSTDDINLGEGSVEGTKLVVTAAGDPCDQVDQDGDGTDDAADDDDDGDGTSDADDDFNEFGCENLDEFDSDGDGTADLFESLFSNTFAALKLQTGGDGALSDFFADSDADDVPDGCDEDFGCAPDEFDLDGDCIPDSFDFCEEDGDADGVSVCEDCNDADPSSTFECYESCGDADNDGADDCFDCDPLDPAVTVECYDCSTDADGDTVPSCADCDDADPATTYECYGVGCTTDLECQEIVSALGAPQDVVDATSCLVSTGECGIDCNLASDPATCVGESETNGAFCDAGTQFCTFFF